MTRGKSGATLVSLMPDDGSLAWVGLWIVPDSESLDATIALLREKAVITESFSEVKLADDDGKVREIDGSVTTHVFTGTATYIDDPDEDGEGSGGEIPVGFAYNVFEISEDTVGVMCCIASAEAIAEHEDVLMALRTSLRLVRE
jgi:hypothetical protein